MNFFTINSNRAILCVVGPSLLHKRQGFLASEESTNNTKFLSSRDSFTRMGATLVAAPSRWGTSPTNGKLGYYSSPLSMPAMSSVVLEEEVGSHRFERRPSHSILSSTALTRKPAIIIRVLDRRLGIGWPANTNI